MKSRLFFTQFLLAFLPILATAQYGYNRPIMNYLQYFSLPQSGDIDGDGDMDVVTSLNFAGELLWFENLDGLGLFSTRKVLKTGVDLTSVIQMRDYDLDGDLDIAMLYIDDKDIVLFRNDGAGNFAEAEILVNNFASGLRTIKSVDLDNDGDLDLVLGDTYATNFFWLENYSDNNEFSDELKLIWDMGPGEIKAYDFGDIDNDGDLDIVAAKVENTGIPNGPVGKIQYYRNQGNGVFDSLKTVKIVDPPVQAGVDFTGMQLGDFNEDGGLDIAVLSSFDNLLYWYENNFETWLPIPWDDHVVGIANGVNLLLEDMDNDGDRDFVVTRGSLEKECYVFEHDLSSPFLQDHLVMDSEEVLTVCETADFDGDGDLDILTRGQGGNIAWFKNFGNNLYGGRHIIIPGLVGTGVAQGADIDHDNKMDVIFVSNGGDEIWFYPGLSGTGTFDEPEKLFETEDVADFHLNDFNQDGVDDLVYCSKDGGFVAWREGLTTSVHFGPEKIVANNTLNGSPWVVKSPDLNGDGLPDILVASYTDSKIAWYRNEGNETFQVTPVISFEMPLANSVNTADFDNDGDLDIIATARQTGEIALFENTNGAGSFGGKEVVDIVNDVESALVADIDDDGNMDIITVGDGDDLVLLLRGLAGFNNFAAADTLAKFFNGVEDIETEDVDKDGDLDILVARGSQGIGWFENNGTGQFNEYAQLESGNNVQSLALANLDGDDDLDLIYTSSGIVQLGYFANVVGELNATEDAIIKPAIAKIYPNPFHQTLSIEIFDEAVINNCQLQLINPNGKLVATQNITEKQVVIENIDVKGLLFYQLRDLKTGKIIASGKLLGF